MPAKVQHAEPSLEPPLAILVLVPHSERKCCWRMSDKNSPHMGTGMSGLETGVRVHDIGCVVSWGLGEWWQRSGSGRELVSFGRKGVKG